MCASGCSIFLVTKIWRRVLFFSWRVGLKLKYYHTLCPRKLSAIPSSRVLSLFDALRIIIYDAPGKKIVWELVSDIEERQEMAARARETVLAKLQETLRGKMRKYKVTDRGAMHSIRSTYVCTKYLTMYNRGNGNGNGKAFFSSAAFYRFFFLFLSSPFSWAFISHRTAWAAIYLTSG